MLASGSSHKQGSPFHIAAPRKHSAGADMARGGLPGAAPWPPHLPFPHAQVSGGRRGAAPCGGGCCTWPGGQEAAARGPEARRPGCGKRGWGPPEWVGAGRGPAFFSCWALRASERPWDHGGVRGMLDSRICPNPRADVWGAPRPKHWGGFQPQCCLCLLARASVGPSIGRSKEGLGSQCRSHFCQARGLGGWAQGPAGAEDAGLTDLELGILPGDTDMGARSSRPSRSCHTGGR